MASTTLVTCDICKATISTPKKERDKIPVVFLTEQTEGRYTTPHITFETMDICDTCKQKLIADMPLVAEGAQGYNRYSWR